ncbi:MAG: ribonuclease P protein component [Hyphomicrobiales bacterium]|nr:ribonuclease P protein component [Hyphomicrobiales bacterium]
MARGPRKPQPTRLKKRAEFLAAARGKRRHAAAFALQAVLRSGDDAEPPRFGLTVSKKVDARAVRRNRIRRRLRAALVQGAALSAAPGVDYVFVARAEALGRPFAALVADMAGALTAIGRPEGRTEKRRAK